MDSLCILLSLISLGIISIVTIILFVQYHRFKNTVKSDFNSIVSQINDVNNMYLNINNVQDNNIKSLDNNLNILKTQETNKNNSVYLQGSQMLVTKNPDGTIIVCQPDGSVCRTL